MNPKFKYTIVWIRALLLINQIDIISNMDLFEIEMFHTLYYILHVNHWDSNISLILFDS